MPQDSPREADTVRLNPDGTVGWARYGHRLPMGDAPVYDGTRRVDGVAWTVSEQQRTHSRPVR